MDINIFKFYRIFAVVGLAIIAYEIFVQCKLFLSKDKKNTICFLFPFFISAVIWVLYTTLFVLGDLFGKPDGLDSLNPLVYPDVKNVFILFLLSLFIQIGSTILLFLFCGKFMKFHLVFNPKKRRKPWTFNLEESYFVYYGFLKRKRVVWLRDIIVEESCYISKTEYSKAFPIASIMSSEERLLLKLINGKTYKIRVREAFVAGNIDGLLTIVKVMNIPFLHITQKNGKKIEQWIQNKPDAL